MKKIAFFLFLSTLVFAPLAFGTVERWSLASLEIITASAFSIYFFYSWVSGKASAKIVGILPLSLLLIFLLFQLIPLPPDLVKFISPGTYEVYRPILALLDHENWIPLSVDRGATLRELLRLTSYGMIYVLTIQLLRSPEKLKLTINVVVFLAASIALLAIIQRISSPDKIYWFRAAPVNARPFGPWVNVNQFAGYIELLCPLAFGLFLFYKPRVRSDETLRKKFVSFFTVPAIHFHLFLGFAAVLMVLAVFVSLCRGGILSLVIAGTVFLILYNLKFPKSSGGALLLLFLCSFAAITWFGWGTIGTEFSQSFDDSGSLADSRLTLWSDSIGIIKTFPIFGAGFGTFLSLYPLYKTIDSDLIYDHAHNDYIELLTDGGMIGLGLVAWFVLAVLWHGWKMIRVRRDQYSILLGIGSMAGIVALLAHSFTDFNMHNGAIGFYFFFLSGILVSSVNCRFNYSSPGSLLRKQSPRCNIFFALGGGVILFAITAVQLGSFKAGYHYSEIKNIYVSKHLSSEKLNVIADNMQRSILLNPMEGLYSYTLGSVQGNRGKSKDAVANYLSAGMKNPLEGLFLQQIGLSISNEEQGKLLIEEGYRRALYKDRLVLNYAEWLLWKGNRKEALELLRTHLQKDYHQIDKWMVLLNTHDITHQELIFIMPESVEAWLRFGRYFERNNNLPDAELFFSGALDFLPDRGAKRARWFTAVIAFFQRHGEKDKALKVIRQAVQAVPNYALFHILLGDYYLREGISYRAKEEYERALFLEPGNGRARSKLRKMGYEDSY